MEAFHLLTRGGMHVQNNISETTNNVVQSMVSLKGNHSMEKLTRRIRSFYTIKNSTDYKTFLTESMMEVRVLVC
ncbi:MAG: hypothetical protein ACTSUE_16970 [Promethearchaeota archaeon]